MKHIKLIMNRRLLTLILFGCTVLASCTKRFTEINTNKNSIATVGPGEIPFLFSKAQSTATGSQWNYQVAENLFADQYCQYFACVATYFPSDRLVIRMDWVGAAFNPMYSDVMPQLQTILENTDSLTAEHALAEVWWVYTFHRVTDYWGPIPYFSAGQPAVSVPYDAQDKIYDDFFKRLDAAAAVLKTQTSATAFGGSYDLVYGGNVAKWLKFTNTLRLRLALRISKVDPTRAKTEGEAAIADGLLTKSPDDDAFVARSTKGSDGNGLSIMSDWNEFRMSASMASVLNGYSDPRRSSYFLPAVNGGGYKGVRNGLTATQLTLTPNTAAANSHVGPRWASPAAGGQASYLTTPQNVMVTAEAWFLLAEASTLGWNVGSGMTTQQLYERGITESMHQWGITDATNINNYINSTATPVAPGDYMNSPAVSDVPIKWSSDPATQLQQIATQKWLALFPDGMEAWADWRRSHVMKLYTVVNSDNTDINPNTQWIRRIPFLLSEQQTNAAAVQAALPLLNGPDKVTTPLWWDKN